ncbi:M12 family metallopeptidase, partial [Salmonella sp. s51228]|uniref:M12 family metallopeptidase n=1 Tax=Salmonella sp. s51228 TaxID=3159652 RepID=UPI003980A3CA
EIPGIVIHEIFHALGRWHEQSRPDRSDYIDINLANIIDGTESNFERLSETFVSTQGRGYDYSSIMHYGQYAFARDRSIPTITTKQPSFQNTIGQRANLSPLDEEHV